MANTLLTSDVITREALRVLHEKLVFTGKINKQYDSSFAQSGAKIGDSLRIRKPAKFSVRDGATISVQDFIEENLTLTINKQKGVDFSFSDVERSLSLDDFSKRVLEPAMAQLASSIEADTLSMIGLVDNSIYNASGIVYKDSVKAKAKLNQSLTPMNDLCMMIDPLTEVELIDELKGLFQDSSQISKQYREGMLGRTSGFDWYGSNIMATITMPSDVVGTITVVEGTSTATLAGLGLSTTYPAGFRFTVSGVKKVHAETKKAYADDYEFVALSDFTTDGSGNGTISIRPVYSTGARQNISSAVGGGSAIVSVIPADTTARQNIAFHKDAFTMATADLTLPKGTDMASRQNFDGISMRFVSDFDITDGSIKSRFDVLYGYQVLRSEFGCVLQEPNV